LKLNKTFGNFNESIVIKFFGPLDDNGDDDVSGKLDPVLDIFEDIVNGSDIQRRSEKGKVSISSTLFIEATFVILKQCFSTCVPPNREVPPVPYAVP